MLITQVDFEVRNNVDWVDSFQLASDPAGTIPIDLTANTVRMVVSPSGHAGNSIELSTANGRIVILDATTGKLQITVPYSVLRLLTPGAYVHDMIRIFAGRKIPVWVGTLSIIKGVS